METSASLNSGFNVLEALRFLLQLFLFIHEFFLYNALKMSLTSLKFPPAPAVQWIRGKREGLEQQARSSVFTGCCVGDGDLGAVLSLPIAISFPRHFSLCSKNICTYHTLLHVGCIPSVVLKEKGGKKKAKQEEKKSCSL